MHPYMTLIDRLASGTPWQEAVLLFWFDLGAMGVEREENGQVTLQKGLAIGSKNLVQWDILEVTLFHVTYRLYFREGVHIADQDNMVGFIQGLDVLLHDQELLRTSAMHDPLTGALNRRGLDHWFELRKQGGYGVGFVLVYLDLDHFKALNDTRGHQTGDEALKEITTILRRTLRNTDVVARLGGDEFVFIIDQTPCHPDIRARLTEIVERLPLAEFGLTVTLGVTCYPTHGTELSQLLAKADAELYEGKSLGRNRIILYGECGEDDSV